MARNLTQNIQIAFSGRKVMVTLEISYYTLRSPKKGLVAADFNSSPAVLSIASSTLSRGRHKNSPPILSNPQSSRNSTPPLKFPTLSCSISWNFYNRSNSKAIKGKKRQGIWSWPWNYFLFLGYTIFMMTITGLLTEHMS